VLTGVSTAADAVLAPPGRRPTYVASDLSGLLTGQPEVTAGDGGFTCGSWTARLDADAGKLELSGPGSGSGPGPGLGSGSGSGDPMDALRALCGAAWSGPGVTPDMAASALHGLDLPS